MKIKLTVLLGFCLLLANLVFSQTTGSFFTPKWKAGDKRTVKVSTRETEIENGKTSSDTTSYSTYTIEVLKDNPDHYMLRVNYENAALKSTAVLSDKMGGKLDDLQNLPLDIKVSKADGKAELVNWQQIQSFMNISFTKIQTVLEDNDPEVASLLGFVFLPLKATFKDKESIEAYMVQEVGYLFTPFNMKFTQADTLKKTENCLNPFNPADSISFTTTTWITDLDEAKKTCAINSNFIYDLSAFKKMMNDLMRGMMEAFDAGEETVKEAESEINAVEFDMTNLEVLSFDYAGTWPLKVIRTVKIIAGDTKERTEKTIRSTITLK